MNFLPYQIHHCNCKTYNCNKKTFVIFTIALLLLSYLLRSPGEISCDLSAQGRKRLSHILSNLVKQETRDTWLVHGNNEIKMKHNKNP